MDVTASVAQKRHRPPRLRTGTVPARVGREVLLRRVLALADAVAVVVAIAALGVFAGAPLERVLWAAFFVPLWVVLAKLHGLYDRDQRALRHLTVDELPALLTWATAGTALLALLLLATPAHTLGGGMAIRLWLFAWSSALVLRGGMRWAWRRMTPPDRALLVGGGPSAEAIRRKLALFPDIHVQLQGELETLRPADFDDTAWLDGIDRIFLAGTVDDELIGALVALCRRRQVRLSVVPPVAGLFGTAVQLNHVADLPLVEYSTWHVSRSTILIKRMIDVAVAAVGLVVLSPLLLAIAVAVLVDGGRPVLFRQQRAGTGARPFTMLKFRTMVPRAEELLPGLIELDDLAEPVFKLVPDPRVTRVGRVLRRWSLDELPQLVNVLRGAMSLVGPRPEQVELVARYRSEHRIRLAVKPGLTGPMQVFGRGSLSFGERLALEQDYVENVSLRRDLRILALTITAMIGGRGAF